MAGKIMERLAAGEILVSDGGNGTMFQALGLEAGHCSEEFNLTRPDLVRQVHGEFFAAGSDLVETNTFGAIRPRLKHYGLEESVAEINRRGAELAREVCPPGGLVAASVAPTGELLEPFGAVTATEAEQWYAEQIEALVAGGVDLIIVETMQTIEEALLALGVARAAGLPVFATMTFSRTPQGFRTAWGVGVEQAVEALAGGGADAVGANCGCGFDEMLQIVRVMRPLTDKPILAQSNAGMPEVTGGRTVFPETPDSIEEAARQIIEAGVNIIGGCCGTTPDHIARIRRLVDSRARA